MRKTTPENITELGFGEVFVFGSNLLGNHAGGAARLAHDKFGAETGVGEGMTGNCYAFPTLDENMEKVSETAFSESVKKLYEYCRLWPSVTFYLTKVGCGIAGFEEKFVKNAFMDAPENLAMPEGWGKVKTYTIKPIEWTKITLDHMGDKFKGEHYWSAPGYMVFLKNKPFPGTWEAEPSNGSNRFYGSEEACKWHCEADYFQKLEEKLIPVA